ncbi:MAG TPA: LD-carboxypeptidase [Paludibacter sp.]
MTPPYLKPNDQIRIVSPSGNIEPKYIVGAKKTLTTWGLNVTEGKFARAKYGRFAGTEAQRIADLQEALDDPSVNAILCSRGGYGVAQIIDKLDFSTFAKSPKWLIGFSDITILHNAISNLGIASIHGIMAKHLTQFLPNSIHVQKCREILFGQMPTYIVPKHILNKVGIAQGKLIGGNLSVLIGLRGSQFDLDCKNNILFIEDIAERPYHIDRMMQNLRFSGALAQLSGLVVGQFSDCDEDPLMKKSVAQIIASAVSEYDYPVCFNFPAGHVDNNFPLKLGETVQFEVTKRAVILTF